MNKRKKTGTRLALLGLTIGLTIGLGLLILKEYLADQLVQVLRDEVESSCDCQFEVDSARVSLLTFKATALNAKVISKKQTLLRL